ncbi:uncharacterized protein LOC134696719 [Mytilus trossulus]|uniref:uncharacterized protein LOC134696719 n=1 Tax=Mytilus trossulus TaxID=6551 RepID=UPI003004BA74
MDIKVPKYRGIHCRMAQHYKISFVLLVVIFLSRNACYAQLTLEDDTQEFFFIQDGGISGAGSGTVILDGADAGILGGSGADFSALSALLPLLLLAPLLLAATAPTEVQAVQTPASAAAAVIAPGQPQTPVPQQTITVLVPPATTQCVSETCPPGFRLLPNQASSTSCYSDSGATLVDRKIWNAALLDCAKTRGAYLWRPNTAQEAAAVRNQFDIANNALVWTGAFDIDQDNTFTFAIENGELNLNSVPFGTAPFISPNPGTDCVNIKFDGTQWLWTDGICANPWRYICEYPRRVCP